MDDGKDRHLTGGTNTLVRAAVWVGMSKIVTTVLSFISTIVLARLLLPSDFGLVAIAQAIMVTLVTITELSVAQALIQQDDLEEEHYHTAWTLSLARGLFFCLGIVALSFPVAHAYSEPRLLHVLWVMGLIVLAGSLANPKMVTFQRRLDFRQSVALDVTSKVTALLVALAIAVYYQSYWALVVGTFASQIVATVMSYFFISYRPRICLTQYRGILRFSVWLTMGRWVQALNWRGDPILLGYLVPPSQLGQYSFGLRLSNMAIGEVLSPITQILFPALATLKGKPDRLRAGYLRAQGIVIFAAVGLGAGFSVLAAPLIPLLIGDKWLPAVPLIQVLALTAILPRLQSIQPLAMATGQTKALFWRDVRAFLVRLPLFVGGIILGDRLGIGILMGAVLGAAAGGIVNSVMNMALVAKISTISMIDQLVLLWRPAVAAMSMYALLSYLTYTLRQSGTALESVTGILALIGIGGICYVGTGFAIWFLVGRPQGAERHIIDLGYKVIMKLRRKGS